MSRTPQIDATHDAAGDEDAEHFSWVNDSACDLIGLHVSGGYVVKDLYGDWLREPDHFSGGTRVHRFEEWGDAYMAALRIVEAA